MIADKSATNTQLVEPRSRNLPLKIWPLKLKDVEKKDKKIRLDCSQEHGDL